MWWRSTTNITREEAISLIIGNVYNLTDGELENTMEVMGFGESIHLPYYGYTFNITNHIENEDSGEENDFI